MTAHFAHSVAGRDPQFWQLLPEHLSEVGRLAEARAKRFCLAQASVPSTAVGLSDRGQLAIGAGTDLIPVARIAQSAVLLGTWVQGHRCAVFACFPAATQAEFHAVFTGQSGHAASAYQF